MSQEAFEIDPRKLLVLDDKIGATVLSAADAKQATLMAMMARQALSSLDAKDFIELFEAVDSAKILYTDSEEQAAVFSFVASICTVLNNLEVECLTKTGLSKVALRVRRPVVRSMACAYLETSVLKEYWMCLEAMTSLSSFLSHRTTPVGLYRKYTLELIACAPAIIAALANTRVRANSSKRGSV